MNTAYSSLNQPCLLTLIEHYHQLASAMPFDPSAQNETLMISKKQALNLEACAQVSIADVADTLDLMGELISHYTENDGSEQTLFSKTGNTLHLLSGVLVLADRVGERAGEALSYYAQKRDLQ